MYRISSTSLKDADGRYVTVNQTLVKRCGRTCKSELIGPQRRRTVPSPPRRTNHCAGSRRGARNANHRGSTRITPPCKWSRGLVSHLEATRTQRSRQSCWPCRHIAGPSCGHFGSTRYDAPVGHARLRPGKPGCTPCALRSWQRCLIFPRTSSISAYACSTACQRANTSHGQGLDTHATS